MRELSIEKRHNSLQFLMSQIEYNDQEIEKVRTKMELLKEKIHKIESELEHMDTSTSRQGNVTKEDNVCDTHSMQIKLRQLKVEYLRETELFEQLQDKSRNYEEIIQYINSDETADAILLNESHRSDIGINILELQENEKQRIARDLHDTTVQNLTALIHKTELCIRYMDIDTVQAKLELMTMMNLIKNNVKELRNVIYDMRPMILDDIGLIAAIQKATNYILSSTNIYDIDFNYDEDVEKAGTLVKTSLYRIISEALNNIVKHANASKIKINIELMNDIINIEIEDNGVGFDIESMLNNNGKEKHYGIAIMRERILLLGGSFSIKSEINQGTIIHISLSMNVKE